MEQRRTRGASGWALAIYSFIMALLGVLIGGGGAWLVVLGGSFYYLLAGIGLLISGVLLIMLKPAGAWLYGVVFTGTVIWALWEVGLDGWGLVPRLVGPAVLAVILLFFIPVLRRSSIREGSYT